MSNDNFTAIGCVITLVGVLSFLGLLAANFVVVFISVFLNTGAARFYFVPFGLVSWGVWYGVVLVIRAKRAAA